MHILARSGSVFFIICGAIAIATSVVSAQALPVSPYGIDISASSNNPQPGQTVTLTARSYTENINAATVVWTVEGKEVKRGIGATTLEIKAPALGKKDNITVTAILAGGGRQTGSIILGSGSIDLVVETDGYVHPLFQGKMFPALQNTVKIVAFPHLANSSGVEYDPKVLTYTWKKDDQTLESQSGYGKQSAKITGSVVPRPYVVSVIAKTRDGSAQAEGLITISAENPELNFYIDDPLYGPLLNKAVKTEMYLGREREARVLAVPWGFNRPVSSLGNLLYSWNVNAIDRPDLATSESIVLRAPADTAGSSNISLRIRNTEEILQGVLAGFTVFFSAQPEEENNSTSF